MATHAYIYESLPGEPGGSLLFVFHGTGGDENQLLGLGRDLLARAAVVSPRGDVSEHGAARFFRRTGEGVYDMADLARATDKMAGFVDGHIERLQPSKVLGLGYSNGANILASVLFRRPGLFDGSVLMHPLIPFEPVIEGTMAGRRTLITAGMRDPICPPEYTVQLEAELRRKGADVRLDWHEGGHEIRQNEIAAAKGFLAGIAGDGGSNG